MTWQQLQSDLSHSNTHVESFIKLAIRFLFLYQVDGLTEYIHTIEQYDEINNRLEIFLLEPL